MVALACSTCQAATCVAQPIWTEVNLRLYPNHKSRTRSRNTWFRRIAKPRLSPKRRRSHDQSYCPNDQNRTSHPRISRTMITLECSPPLEIDCSKENIYARTDSL